MPDPTKTRWTLTVSKETDVALRSFLAQRGLKKGDLSLFVEEAVKWRILDQTINEARAQFADLPVEMMQALVDEASEAVKSELRQALSESRTLDH
ncbi:ribbon-helix-helix domain-containing protein [Imhoffiella purpurea]|uniref:XACb0070 ribbon-helix-helix domain-containing protein n=1 Tax=Imhoffiella purpurea TaxID=1249627 RepID=W9VAN0_9GAMM|nr:ribbon-helix-helix domain-containing protein [Imhoffiella purpurea]EXJ16668.1 hypothetical protein D779_3982 [Imhoffiella purpurea]